MLTKIPSVLHKCGQQKLVSWLRGLQCGAATVKMAVFVKQCSLAITLLGIYLSSKLMSI
jgi:hypothetical protein